MSHTQTFLDSLRPEIKNLPLYNAGVSSEYVRSNYKVQEVAKLGSNENSHGTSPKVLAAIAGLRRKAGVLDLRRRMRARDPSDEDAFAPFSAL